MTAFFLTILILFLAVLTWLVTSRLARQRRLRDYTRAIWKFSEHPDSPLPEGQRELTALAEAIRSLILVQQGRIQALDADRVKLSTVLDRMTDGVLIVDSEGRLEFTNPAAERLFDMEQPLGRTVVEVVRQHQLISAWRRSRETGQPQEESVELPAQHQFLQLVALPDHQSGGSLLLVQNLTRVRRLETIRRDFISNVSHELRTPLASLKALTETLHDGALEDPAAARRFLERIETEVDALTQMAQELLELTRIESGQVPLEMIAIPAGDLLEAASERMRAQAERAGLEIRLQQPLDRTLVRADATRLEQVLVNLIHNAVKFTPPGGEIDLADQAEGNVVRFSVRDSGVGIPADNLERIFERFFKADRARSSGGTGLGLSIARHIVEAHGGRIWAESVEGQGSTFLFTIPVVH
jgi:two-component system phosphate regulon sensor histidine kinase PhoR